MTEIMVRMGEIAVSSCADEVLVSIGLGSCIGLALVHRRHPIAGLAHVMLPAASPEPDLPGRFADTAVPELLRRLSGLGALPRSLDAVIVGGAKMFSFGGGGGGSSTLDVGARNEAAVRAALATAGLSVRTADTGGSSGRTVRVRVGPGAVSLKTAGGTEAPLHATRGGAS